MLDPEREHADEPLPSGSGIEPVKQDAGSGGRGALGVRAGTLVRSVWAALPIWLAGGVAYGLFEAVRDPGVRGLGQHLAAAQLAGIPGLGLGLIASPCWALIRRRPAWQRGAAWLAAATRRDPESERGPVLRLHAACVIIALSTLGWIAVAKPVFSRLFELQEQTLGVALAVVLTTVTLVATGVAAFALAPHVERALGWLDRRWRLPLPPGAWARYLLFVALPSAFALSWFAEIQGDLLGPLGLWIAIPFVLVSAGLIAHAWRLVRPRSERWRVLLGVATLVAWGIALGLGARHATYAAESRSSSPAAALGSLLTGVFAPASAASSAPTADAGAVAPAPASAFEDTFFEPPSRARAKLSVVWVIVDALRADRVSALRDGRSLTPNLDRLAAESVVFERAYTQGTSTSYSIPSMLTGRNVDALTWAWMHERPQILDSEITIAERLREHGYRTGIVASQFVLGFLTGLLQGYDEQARAAGTPRTHHLWKTRTSPLATARALQQIAAFTPGALPSRPFFLTVYYDDPHSPYVRHVDGVRSLPDTPQGHYDSDVAFVDLHLGQLIEHLRSRASLWKRTVLIVTSDHGEAFGEHGRERHGRDCHVEAVHVPLLIRVPGVRAARIPTPVALVDVVPTLLELSGAPREELALSGQSLLIPMRAPERVDPERPIFCAAAHQRGDQRPYLARAVRRAGYALIQSGSGVRALFDTSRDPGELQDVLNEPAHAETARQLAELLDASLTGSVGQPPPSAPQPSAESSLAED